MSYETVNGLFTGIADAIRSVDGTVDPIAHQDMPTKISGIPAAFTGDATATASDILLGETAYAGGAKLTGTNTNNADTTDATAVENSLLYGHTAYGADGTKLTGAGAYWQYITGAGGASGGLFYSASGLPETMVIYAPNMTKFDNILRSASGVKHFDITHGNISTGALAVYICSTLETLTLHGSWASCTTWNSTFRNNAALHSVLGDPISMAGTGTYVSVFVDNPALVNIAFVASSIMGGLSFVASSLLSNASLLSIANGLDGTAVGKTLTMHATSKMNMGSIMVDNVAGVAELGSAMTLSAFITGVKGWTIA